MRIALVHDWFTVYGGAEKVAKEILALFDNIDVYSLVDFLSEEDRIEILSGEFSNTSFIQKLPFARKKYRNYLPLFPFAIEQFDLSSYDLVISSSYSVAKGVLTHSNQIHICYCHSPARYAWDLYYQYLKEANLTSGFQAILSKFILHYLRIWDVASSNRVDYYIANSKYIARRIKKIYNKDATVIYPPVDLENFICSNKKEGFYLTASRMVPYKKIDLIVEAFSKMPEKKLIVIGDGPDFNKIKNKAKSNIKLLGYQKFEVLKAYMQKAEAFVFAAEEDFGIIPVEAQACGTPVIAYGKGGVLETVKDKITGVFFYKQDIENIIQAVNNFEKIKHTFDHTAMRKNAENFNKSIFKSHFSKFIQEKCRV